MYHKAQMQTGEVFDVYYHHGHLYFILVIFFLRGINEDLTYCALFNLYFLLSIFILAYCAYF